MAKKKSMAKSSEKGSSLVGKSGRKEELEEVFRLMAAYGIGELELENDEGRVHARMASAMTVPHPSVQTVSTFPSTPTSSLSMSATKEAVSAKSSPASNQKKILSPFVGTFYRASNPNAAPYVKEGQTVKKGQTLCIIEAMKLMNEIESEFDGKIVSILVENGQPVEFGETLFILE